MGRKQKTERKKERERLNDGNNNGQLRIANATSGGARKYAWAKKLLNRKNDPCMNDIYHISLCADIPACE